MVDLKDMSRLELFKSLRWPEQMYFTNSSRLPLATSCFFCCCCFFSFYPYLDIETEIPFSDSFLYDLKFFTIFFVIPFTFSLLWNLTPVSTRSPDRLSNYDELGFIFCLWHSMKPFECQSKLLVFNKYTPCKIWLYPLYLVFGFCRFLIFLPFQQ